MKVPSGKTFLRDGAIRVFVALLAVGAASAATPSGQITANPEVVIIPSGASSGTTAISWTTVNCTVAQVTVTAAGGTEHLFGDATSRQNSLAPWIGLNTFTFRLYGDRTRTLLLDSVVVTGVRSASGSIRVSPLTFPLATADATFSTTLSWTTSDGITGRVTRSTAGGGQTLIAEGVSNGGFGVSGLGAGETVFRLYADAALTQLLDSIVVTGVLPLPGSITANPSTFTVGAGTTFSTGLSWTTSEGSAGWVTRSAAGGAEELVAQGGSTYGFEVSDLVAGRTVFRLYGDEARTQSLGSVEVVGTIAPLTVQAAGTLRLDNRPFTGVGVNYFDGFNRVLVNSAVTSYEAGLEALRRWGFSFARVDFSGNDGFQPNYTALFFTDRGEFFRRLDAFVASAERNGVGLIPSLFWTKHGMSDLAGERLDQLAVSTSVTRQRMREFTTEIVNRYKNSRAIWAWEFGNEWNLAVDLPNATDFLSPTNTAWGNPPTRDPVRDVLTTDIILPAMQEFANLVKSLDPGRPISCGHAIPRTAAWHMDRWKRGLLPLSQVWTTDSYAQAKEIALRHCPAPFDLLSIHPYSISEDAPRVANYAQIAAESGKALFAGEFGVDTSKSQNPQSEYDQLLAASRVAPLVAMWAYDRFGWAANEGWTATTTNSRSWMLRKLLPSTFTAWSRGWGADEVPGPDGATAAAQYSLGSPRPGVTAQSSAAGWSTNALWLEAVVRTNDPSWRIFGQTSSTLAPGSWGTNDVVSISSTNQSDVLPGCERRVFSVLPGTDRRKFLRIRAESP